MTDGLYLSYSSAFLIGLLGSTHCLGMCGGISASLSMALPVGRGFRVRQTLMLLAFNGGRIGSYTLIATLVAVLSTSAAAQWNELAPVLRTLAGILLILMGLSMAQWWQGIRHIERIGAPVWARLSPLTRRFLPVRNGWVVGLAALWSGLQHAWLGRASTFSGQRRSNHGFLRPGHAAFDAGHRVRGNLGTQTSGAKTHPAADRHPADCLRPLDPAPQPGAPWRTLRLSPSDIENVQASKLY